MIQKIHYKLLILLFILLITSSIIGCLKRKPFSLEKPLSLYYENKMEEALPLFRQAALANNNIESKLWLAQAYYRLKMNEPADSLARVILKQEPCNSFAHTILARALMAPIEDTDISHSDSTWFHLSKAVECDSTNGNAWISIWGEAIRRGDPAMLDQSICGIAESGFITKTAFAFGQWLLQTLPKNAILITGGDMDTYPAQAVQLTKNFRTDVTIVERGLLDVSWGIRFMRDYYDLPIRFSDGQIDSLIRARSSQDNSLPIAKHIIKIWTDQIAEGSLKRPLAFAATIDESFLEIFNDRLQFSGSFSLYNPLLKKPDNDIATIKASLDSIRDKDFSGPCVSRRDTSPIRRMYAKYMPIYITNAALIYCEELIKQKKTEAATEILDWARAFEKRTVLGSYFAEKIDQLFTDIVLVMNKRKDT